ncbi:MAG: prepilin-type N-terminal cleavage/methylation domain-containing protein [Deltaproteobacteria bacterium]|nr:prepilin-type N-terminal cleavage/methylation domain-containing protein [Deltaproteobacteria bacterium]
MRRNYGFTLLEVMISIAILGVIMTLIWASTGQSLRAKDRTEARDMSFHMGRVSLRKITDDVVVAFLSKKQKTSSSSGIDASGGASTSGIKTFFIGEDQSGQDNLRFTSLSHMRYFSGAKESDQCKIAYEIVPDKEDSNILNLVRREDPWLDNTTEVKGKPLVLVRDVREFNLEYYNGRKNEWVKNWDTEKIDWKARLPDAVKITLVFPDPDDEEGEYEIILTTSIMLALSSGPIGS